MNNNSINITKLFGERLRELRTDKGLSVKELADKLGFSDVAIVYWENNKRAANAVAIYRIAQFFGVSSDYLLGLEN